MGEFKLVIIIIYAQSLCNHFTLCVYDADFTEEEEIERETVPSQIYENSTIQQCPFFVYNSGFTIDKMPALWNSVYYKMPNKLGCFHLLIRKTSVEEREKNKRIYGDFNRTINWDLCQLEIKYSQDKKLEINSAVKSRVHFLHGGVGDFGVLRNIILVSTDDGSYGVYNLREGLLYQWLMVNDLLILHGCGGDEVVVFSRAPRHASKQDVAEALRELGEEITGEMQLCVDP